jgi:hypothetical protein
MSEMNFAHLKALAYNVYRLDSEYGVVGDLCPCRTRT